VAKQPPSAALPQPGAGELGLEPVCLLIEPEMMEQLSKRAALLGMGYDSLVKRILREHIGKY